MILVASLERAEETLLAGDMPCTRCQGALRPFGTGRTEVTGNALVAKSPGAGYRRIAARFGRPESTGRRWLRAGREPHAQWLYRRGADPAVLVDRELLVRPADGRRHCSGCNPGRLLVAGWLRPSD